MTDSDWRTFGVLAAICAGVGVLYSALSGDNLFFGIAAGLLLFAFIMAIGFLAMWVDGKKR